MSSLVLAFDNSFNSSWMFAFTNVVFVLPIYELSNQKKELIFAFI
jgi:hypothetical protein